MATKKIKATDNVEIISDTVQLVSEQLGNKLKSNLEKPKKATSNEIKVIADEPQVAPTKMVKILMSSDHKCFVGGEWYYLLANKHYNVPENVKEILMKANKLKPL